MLNDGTIVRFKCFVILKKKKLFKAKLLPIHNAFVFFPAFQSDLTIKTSGRIFSCEQPFYERVVSDLDP
jgi:hypothetical protein